MRKQPPVFVHVRDLQAMSLFLVEFADSFLAGKYEVDGVPRPDLQQHALAAARAIVNASTSAGDVAVRLEGER